MYLLPTKSIFQQQLAQWHMPLSSSVSLRRYPIMAFNGCWRHESCLNFIFLYLWAYISRIRTVSGSWRIDSSLLTLLSH